MKRLFLTRILAVASEATLAISAASADIVGAGSTFVFPVMAKWAAAYTDHLNKAVRGRYV